MWSPAIVFLVGQTKLHLDCSQKNYYVIFCLGVSSLIKNIHLPYNLFKTTLSYRIISVKLSLLHEGFSQLQNTDLSFLWTLIYTCDINKVIWHELYFLVPAIDTIMSTTMIITQPQPMMVAQDSQEWSSGICDCCDDLPECKSLCFITYLYSHQNKCCMIK